MLESGSTLTRTRRGSEAVMSLIGPWSEPIGMSPASTKRLSSARRHEGFQGGGSVSAATASAFAFEYSFVWGVGRPLSPGRPEIAARKAIAGRLCEPIMDSWPAHGGSWPRAGSGRVSGERGTERRP
jgi:hypothetical protein